MNRKGAIIILLGIMVIYPADQAFNQDYQDPLRIFKNGKYLFVDITGKIVIPQQFDCAGRFVHGYAPICGQGGYDYLINVKGDKLEIPDATLYGFSEGLIVVKVGEKYGYVNERLEPVILPQFKNANNFSEGLASVLINGKYGFIDKLGKLVIQPQFDMAEEFSEGLAVVGFRKQTKAGEFDPFHQQDRYGYINKLGEMVIKPVYRAASRFSEGLAAVSTKSEPFGSLQINMHAIGGGATDKCGYINKSGKIVISKNFSGAANFSEGLAAVKIGNKYGYIDQKARIIIGPRFEYAEEFHNGLALVAIGETTFGGKGSWVEIDLHGKTGYINHMGEFESPNLVWENH